MLDGDVDTKYKRIEGESRQSGQVTVDCDVV